MGGLYTVYNVKKPIDDSYIVDKKYVDEMDNLKSAFSLKSEGYEAKGVIYMKKKKKKKTNWEDYENLYKITNLQLKNTLMIYKLNI